MVVRRPPNKAPTKVILPRRSTRKAALKATKNNKIHFVAKCTSKSSMRILDLPSENIQKIFSYFSTKDLFYNVRPVCRRFKEIAMSPVLWRIIETENEVPTDTLRSWIKSSKLLKRFCIKHRNDVNTIVEEVSKHGKHLESIKLQNCWGSRKNYLLHSNPLCNLVTRCPKLSSFNFSQSRFMSCKFFRLISKNNRGSVVKKCNYTGPMTPKQMKALFTALEDHEVHDTATIGNVNLNHRFKLRDIVRYVRDVSAQSHVIHEVWENINYGVLGNNGQGLAQLVPDQMYPNANFVANVEDLNANDNPRPVADAEIVAARLGARVAEVIRNANRNFHENRLGLNINRDRDIQRPPASNSRRPRTIQRDVVDISAQNQVRAEELPQPEPWFIQGVPEHDERIGNAEENEEANNVCNANNIVAEINEDAVEQMIIDNETQMHNVVVGNIENQAMNENNDELLSNNIINDELLSNVVIYDIQNEVGMIQNNIGNDLLFNDGAIIRNELFNPFTINDIQNQDSEIRNNDLPIEQNDLLSNNIGIIRDGIENMETNDDDIPVNNDLSMDVD